MRVTNKMMGSNLLRNMTSSMTRMGKIQHQLASGRQINRPSDDPGGILNVMQLKSSLLEVNQYQKNTADAQSVLDATDSALSNVTDILHRVFELTVQGGSGALDEAGRKAISDELGAIQENIFELSNAEHSGRYLFAGQKSTTRPFQLAEDGSMSFHGGARYFADDGTNAEWIDSSSIVYEVAPGSNLVVNIVNQVSEDQWQSGKDSLFVPMVEMIGQIRQDLEAGDIAAVSGTGLDEIQATLDQVLRHRAELGAKSNRIELANQRLGDLELNVNTLIGRTQDVDLAERIMELKMEETGYRTALSIGARIIQPTLIDFLR